MICYAQLFTKLYLQIGYHQIIFEEDIPKTEFRTCYIHYEFLVMSFGLASILITFQQEINDGFQD